MATKTLLQAQNPLILRCHRLIEAFAKSDDERDFFIDRQEGFITYIDLDKPATDIDALQAEISDNTDRYCLIPKLTFYETKKIMEGFVNEKVYDIDTKEKLMEIIGSKEAMANFLDFLNDHHSEFEKWQLYYQERSRVRIIEWLRQNHFTFVFEEDLDLPRDLIERLKKYLFEVKVDKEILAVRKELFNKSKTYYSNEALNPRPKRGRPPKQTTKTEIEPQVTSDMYTTVPTRVLPFLFTPGLGNSPANAFSSRFENVDHTQGPKSFGTDFNVQTEDLKEKLSLLRRLSSRWVESEKQQTAPSAADTKESWDDDDEEYIEEHDTDLDENDNDEEEEDEDFPSKTKSKSSVKKPVTKPVSKSIKKTPALPVKKAAVPVPPKKAQPLPKKTPPLPAKKVAPVPVKKALPPTKKSAPPPTKAKAATTKKVITPFKKMALSPSKAKMAAPVKGKKK